MVSLSNYRNIRNFNSLQHRSSSITQKMPPEFWFARKSQFLQWVHQTKLEARQRMYKAIIILPFSITAENVEVNTAVVWVSTSHVEIDATTIISGSNCNSAEFTFCRIPCKLKSSIMPCMLWNRCRPPIQTRRSASTSEILNYMHPHWHQRTPMKIRAPKNWTHGHEIGRGEFRAWGSVQRKQRCEVSDLPSYLSDKPAMIAASIIR